MGAPLASMLFGFLVRDYLVPRLVNNRPGCGQTLHQDIRHINPQGHHVLHDAGKLIDNIDRQHKPAHEL